MEQTWNKKQRELCKKIISLNFGSTTTFSKSKPFSKLRENPRRHFLTPTPACHIKGAFTLEILIRITLIRISLIRIKFAFTLDKKLIRINLIRITLIRINFAFILSNSIFRIKSACTCLSIREFVYKKFILRLKSKSMMNVHFEMHDVRRNGKNCRDVIFQVITSHSHCRLKTEIIN